MPRDAVSRTANVGTVGTNELKFHTHLINLYIIIYNLYVITYNLYIYAIYKYTIVPRRMFINDNETSIKFVLHEVFLLLFCCCSFADVVFRNYFADISIDICFQY